MRYHRLLKGIPLLPLALCLTACVQQVRPVPETKVYAAYSMLAPASDGSTLIYARVILDGAQRDQSLCPVLEGDDGALMLTRARALAPAAANFPVTVCEARIRPGTGYKVAMTRLKLAPVTLDPQTVLVYGDSGCKTHDCPAGTAAEPFATLAQQGRGRKGQLILHMGDYNYRGTGGSLAKGIYAYDAGDDDYGGPSCGLEETYYSQNAEHSPKPDNWQTWYEDFFLPAGDLLPSAPWVFARGNHELCSRAGVGWFYFFGPGSGLAGGIEQQACPAQGDFKAPPATATAHIKLLPPYMLGLDKLRLWVVDSANACDDRAGNALTAQYQAQFEQLQQRAGGSDKPIWLLGHRPLWGVSGQGQDGPLTLNKMMQTALAQTTAGQLPAQVKLLLSGHMHSYQALNFGADSARPPQLVIGNSGVSLSNTSPLQDFSAEVDGEQARGNAEGKFGFLVIETGARDTWKAQMISEQGETYLRCDSANGPKGENVCQ